MKCEPLLMSIVASFFHRRGRLRREALAARTPTLRRPLMIAPPLATVVSTSAVIPAETDVDMKAFEGAGMSRSKHFAIFTLGLLAIVLLSACGGGGGGGAADTNAAPPSGSSNWDEMVWDQDKWA